MNPSIEVNLISEGEWERYKNMRLAALEFDERAFGGSLESEKLFTEEIWREKARQYIGIIAREHNTDIGFMTVENLKGDFGATCWVGSCWVNPNFRKSGALRAMFTYLDSVAEKNNWQVQGLGVWVDNTVAITAYEKLGFVVMGDPQASSRKPGFFYQRMIRSAAS